MRIDSILGYGSAFPALSTGTTIHLHFNFTLAPTTKDLFPNLKEFYPGLEIGSVFIGDIRILDASIGRTTGRRYTIDGYRKE